jgi:Mg/Co/Ni transporter MgtE
VLQNYEALVRENIVITLFLTMLVGAGGNAGNQSAIRVIRGLATGEMTPTFACFKATVWRQARVGLLLATGLGAGGFARVLITELSMNAGASLTASDVIASDVAQQTPVVGAAAIATSLFVIVTMSTVTGSAMPFALAAAGQDPANAGTTIQVAMDIAGVVITCAVCAVVFSHAGGVDVVQGSLVAGLGGG